LFEIIRLNIRGVAGLRKITIFFLFILIFSTGLWAQGLYDVQKVEGNSIANPGFEESFWNPSMPDYWNPMTGWAGQTQYSLEKNIYHSGKKSLSVTRPDDQLAGAVHSTPITVNPGEYYYIGGYVKTRNASHYASISCRVFDSQGKLIFLSPIATASDTTDWTCLIKAIKMPVDAAKLDLLLVLYYGGQAYFDDVFVTQTKPIFREKINYQSLNILLNSSFEEADFNYDFVDCYNISEGEVAERVSTNTNHGNFALKVNTSQSDENVYLTYGKAGKATIAIEPQKKYYSRVSIFIEDGSPGLVIKIPFYNGGQVLGQYEYLIEDIGLGKWEDVDFEFVTPSNISGAAFSISLQGKGVLYLDNLYFGAEPFQQGYLPRIMPIIPETHRPEGLVPQVKSEIKQYNGVPTIFINDEPTSLVAFNPPLGSLGYKKSEIEYLKKVAEHGKMQVYFLTSYYTPEETGEKYCFDDTIRQLEFQIKTILEEVPDAYFIPWLMLEPTKSFARSFPEETTVLENGDSSNWGGVTAVEKDVSRYTYASEVWARYSIEGIKKIIYYLLQQSYGDRIIGICSGMGQYAEHNWGHARYKYHSLAIDFSPAMFGYFRKWLFQYYDSDIFMFNRAWNKQINFSDAKIPYGFERTVLSYGDIYHPEKDRRVMDYLQCESYAIGHRVIDQGRAIKEASDNSLLTVFMFCYLSGDFNNASFRHVFESQYVDALGAAPPYINRGAGDDIIDHMPLASLYSNNKFLLAQDDVRTHLSGEHNIVYGLTENAKESLGVLKRQVGHHICIGAVPFFMTFGYWYDDPDILKLLEKFDPIFRFGKMFDRKSNAEIAVVIHQDSIFYNGKTDFVKRKYDPIQSLVEYNRLFELTKIGTPYDFYELRDLLNKDDLSQYKMIIMLNCLALGDAERKVISDRLYNDDRSIVWLYAPGIINTDEDDEMIGVKNIKELTGFNVVIENKEKLLTLALTDEVARLGLTPGDETGRYKRMITTGITRPPDYAPIPIRPEIFNPRISVQDKEAVVLGRYKDGGSPGFAIKAFDEYKSIFFGSTALTADVIRGLAKDAGVNIYTDKEAVVYANKHFLMVHVNEGGNYQIKLPESAEIIVELFDEEIVATNTSQFDIFIDSKSTKFFYLGNESIYNQNMKQIKEELCYRFKEWDSLREELDSFLDHKLDPLGKEVSIAGEYYPDQEGFITTFLLAGPFPNYNNTEGQTTDFLQTLGGEAEVIPNLDQSINVMFDATQPSKEHERMVWFNGTAQKKELDIKWVPFQFSKGIPQPLYLQKTDWFTYDYIVYYVACWIELDEDRELVAGIGSDDGNKLWINGEKIGEFSTVLGRSIVADQEKYPVKLKAGKNFILLKIIQGGGGLAHAIRFKDPQTGDVFTNFTVKLTP
jgi:hypothetical protein